MYEVSKLFGALARLLPSARPVLSLQAHALVARRLPPNVTILGQLRERGVSLEPRPGEDVREFEARMETGLMALYRDSRSEQVFQILYEYARPDLLSWIEGLPGRRGTLGGDPLEVLQDTFVNIYRYAASFRDERAQSFRVWAHRIAANLNSRSRRVPAGFSLDALPHGMAEPADRRGDAAWELSLGEERRSLAAAWMIVLARYAAAYESLTERDRRALDLVELQGLSYAAACRELGVRLSNLKMILFRARARIRLSIARELAPLSARCAARA